MRLGGALRVPQFGPKLHLAPYGPEQKLTKLEAEPTLGPPHKVGPWMIATGARKFYKF